MSDAENNELPTPLQPKPTGKWYPGMPSPNPGGRAKSNVRVKELAGQHTEEVITILMGLARNGKSEQARIAAGIALLNRAHGIPAQSLEISSLDEDESSGITDEERTRRIAFALAAGMMRLRSVRPAPPIEIQATDSGDSHG